MKNFALLFAVVYTCFSFAQKKEINLKNGFAAKGYDVVAYYKNKPTEGKKEFTAIYQHIKYKFASKINLETFNKQPQKYIPQYGGWCAYAIAKGKEKVDINPNTYEIRDGKLFLFYNSWGINTLKKWNDEGPETLKKQADQYWRHH